MMFTVASLSYVIPAKAGIQRSFATTAAAAVWIPAFAGMTCVGVDLRSEQ